MSETTNSYLNEVLEQQAVVERNLAPEQSVPSPARPAARVSQKQKVGRPMAGDDSGIAPTADQTMVFHDYTANERAGPPLDYRITGWWLWKTVIVAPNVYVIHTRRGHPEPVNVGLGLSFRYNPYTDAFLIVPAAVQTLIISARCICAERQGVLVQAYVQWVVNDIHTAYRRLDFSDPADRMRIVKIQLREQAEAAIKDKVATMSIDAILTDKQPIIAELTERLKGVAEGSAEGAGSTGLGLKIVTVQIKEAVVSSTRVWENLQKPFRAEREKLARMAEMEAQQQIGTQELANRQAKEMAELEVQRRLAQAKAEEEHERFDREQAENAHRLTMEHDAARQTIVQQTSTEKARREAELEQALHEMEVQKRRLVQELESLRQQAELDKLKAEQERQRREATIQLENIVHEAASVRGERDLGLLRQRRTIENDLSEAFVKSQVVAQLPEIAANLPKPAELRSVHIDGGDTTSLPGLLASLLAVADYGGKNLPGNGAASAEK